jgi:hypothetical protein
VPPTSGFGPPPEPIADRPPVSTVLAPPDAPPAPGLEPPLPIFWELLDEHATAKIANVATGRFRGQRLRLIGFSLGLLHQTQTNHWQGFHALVVSTGRSGGRIICYSPTPPLVSEKPNHRKNLNWSGRPDLNRRHPAPKALKMASQRFAGIHNPLELFMFRITHLYNHPSH